MTVVAVPVKKIQPGQRVVLPSRREFPIVAVEEYEPVIDGPGTGGFVVVYDTGRMSRGAPEDGFAPERVHRSLAIRQAGDTVQVAA